MKYLVTNLCFLFIVFKIITSLLEPRKGLLGIVTTARSQIFCSTGSVWKLSESGNLIPKKESISIIGLITLLQKTEKKELVRSWPKRSEQKHDFTEFLQNCRESKFHKRQMHTCLFCKMVKFILSLLSNFGFLSHDFKQTYVIFCKVFHVRENRAKPGTILCFPLVYCCVGSIGDTWAAILFFTEYGRVKIFRRWKLGQRIFCQWRWTASCFKTNHYFNEVSKNYKVEIFLEKNLKKVYFVIKRSLLIMMIHC